MISKKPEGCVFCLATAALGAKADPSDDPLVVHRGRFSYVVLNLYPYNNGHLMVVPYRHEPTLAGLTRDEMNDVGALTQLSERVPQFAQGRNLGVAPGRLPESVFIECQRPRVQTWPRYLLSHEVFGEPLRTE